MVAGTGSISSPATTSPWPAPTRVHPNIPLFRGAHAGSTKVLATKGSGKTPTVYAGVASTVAFMGPKRWQPPVFYFSSMMAADAEALATDSSLSAHLASVAACMARPPAWESRPQKGRRGTGRRHGRQQRHLCAAPRRVGLERPVAEPRAGLGRQLAPLGEGREVDQRAA